MDRKLPPRRLNMLGAAAAIAANAASEQAAPASPTLDEQIRLARLKLEMKPAARNLNRQLLANVDEKLKEAVQRYLGFPVTDPQQIAGRLMHGTVEGDEGMTYFIDGTPILWVGPADVKVEDTVLHATQEVRQLLPEDFRPAPRLTLALLDTAMQDHPDAGGIILP